MFHNLNWHIKKNILYLSGNLNHENLFNIWNVRKDILSQIKIIDLSALYLTDSAGLAMLVNFIKIAFNCGKKMKFIGINKKIQSLIILYNLQDIIINK